MSSQDKSTSPSDETILPQSNLPEGHPKQATTTAEQSDLQPRSANEHSDVSSLSPSTRSTTPINNTDVPYQYAHLEQAEVAAGVSEPRESHAFLPDEHAVSSPEKTAWDRRQQRQTMLLTTWWLEIVSLSLAMAALVAIAVIMSEYHKKEQPAWKYTINLNTLIAILSALLRVCMVVVVEEVVSQLKWIWFRRPKPLRHLAQFDAAARGPWGSLLLFCRIKRLDSALLGCIIIVFSFGIGPFTQQAVKAVSCNLPLESSKASIAIARYIDDTDVDRFDSAHWDMDMDTKVAILDGLANPNTTRSAIPPGCSTGNCSFPSYNGITHSSVGMCRRCADITLWLIEGDHATYHLENGTAYEQEVPVVKLSDELSIDLSHTVMNVTGGNIQQSHDGWAPVLPDSRLAAFDDTFDTILKSSMVIINIITFTGNGCEQLGNCSHPELNLTAQWDQANVLATTCSFYPCVRDYHGSVKDNVFLEETVSETAIQRDPNPGDPYPAYIHVRFPCFIEGQIYTVNNISSAPKDNRNFSSIYLDDVNTTVPDECLYGARGPYIFSLGDFMLETLIGNCNSPSRGIKLNSPGEYNVVRCEPWYLKALLNSGNATFESIDFNMQSVAMSISSEMRKQGVGGITWRSKKIVAEGTVFRTTICTQFDWIWLAFPLALILLTTLLLFIMCGKTLSDRQGIPAWKSSLLPLLFAGNQIGITVNAGDMDGIVADTDKIVVSLSHNGRGWEFVSQSPDDHDKKSQKWLDRWRVLTC